MMIGVASGEYVASQSTVTITLPASVKGSVSALYGSGGWSVGGNGTGRSISKSGLGGLEVGLLVVELS